MRPSVVTRPDTVAGRPLHRHGGETCPVAVCRGHEAGGPAGRHHYARNDAIIAWTCRCSSDAAYAWASSRVAKSWTELKITVR